MDQVKITKLIKENKGILRQLTKLNNRLEKLEKAKSIEIMSEYEIANIKVGGTD